MLPLLAVCQDRKFRLINLLEVFLSLELNKTNFFERSLFLAFHQDVSRDDVSMGKLIKSPDGGK